MAAALATRVEDLVSMCKWPAKQKEQRRIDLFYHLTDFFDIKCYVQNETIRDGGNLTWEKLVEEAKHQEHVGKEYAKFRRENGGGGTPSYGDPALAADAISRGYKRAQPRSQTPAGGKGQGKSQKQCDQLGNVMAVLAKREPAQHGVGSVAFAKARITTGQPVGRPLKDKWEEVPTLSRNRGKANLLARMEKQRPNTLTPLCLRRSHQQRG